MIAREGQTDAAEERERRGFQLLHRTPEGRAAEVLLVEADGLVTADGQAGAGERDGLHIGDPGGAAQRAGRGEGEAAFRRPLVDVRDITADAARLGEDRQRVEIPLDPPGKVVRPRQGQRAAEVPDAFVEEMKIDAPAQTECELVLIEGDRGDFFGEGTGARPRASGTPPGADISPATARSGGQDGGREIGGDRRFHDAAVLGRRQRLEVEGSDLGVKCRCASQQGEDRAYHARNHGARSIPRRAERNISGSGKTHFPKISVKKDFIASQERLSAFSS